MFLPHTITIVTRQVVIENGETRWTSGTSKTVKAMLYKKDKNTLVEDGQGRDSDKTEYNVIIKKGTTIKEGDAVVPNLGEGSIGEYVVTNIDINYSYNKVLQNIFFTIKKR